MFEKTRTARVYLNLYLNLNLNLNSLYLLQPRARLLA